MKRAIQFNDSVIILENILCINLKQNPIWYENNKQSQLVIEFINGANITAFYETEEEAIIAKNNLLNEINSPE